MSTANHAFSVNREVLALPGRINDEMSEGCNNLIKNNKASLITSASDIMELLGWRYINDVNLTEVRGLFPELEGHNKMVFDSLRSSDQPLTTDAIRALTGIPVGVVISALTELEFEGLILRHPGNRYSTV